MAAKGDRAMILGLGVDIVSNERMERLMSRHGGRAARRLFSESERDYCDATADPATHYAARFAAKEAFVKALGVGFSDGIQWKDVEVVRDERGKPELLARGAAKEALEARGVQNVLITLSHDATHSVAVAILEK